MHTGKALSGFKPVQMCHGIQSEGVQELVDVTRVFFADFPVPRVYKHLSAGYHHLE